MTRARVLMHGIAAGTLEELEPHRRCRFTYLADYQGEPISRTMPLRGEAYEFPTFPAFFDGLLPEGEMLAGLLRQRKIDARDRFGQLLAVGGELVGAITVEKMP